MKKSVIPFLVVVISLFSTTVFAGGTGCDSKHKHMKSLSADALRQFKELHGWSLQDGHDKPAFFHKKNESKHPMPQKTKNEGIEI